MTGSLAGRGVVVTGAGRGVGRGVALACADAGADVIVAAPGDNGADTVADDFASGAGPLAGCAAT